MSINLKKNEKALLAAYNDVVSDKSDTKWVVYGYEGNSNDLKVVETGDGDLEEMTEELSGGKVMYAFIQVTDPNTQLPKNVLVNWAGEGVPPKLKGAYARHTTDVARFLRGAHVTINARSEMDLDEDEVMKKVATASGAKFSVHKEKARAMPATGPVGSVYKRADPTINTKARDAFWDKAEKEEESRRKEEKLTVAQQRKKEEEERRERERQEGTQREREAQERAKRIDQQKQQESAAMRREREEQEAQMQARLKQRETEIDSERQREQRERQQRSNIGASDVKGKKSVFEQKAAEQSRPPARPPPKKVVRPPPAAARREPSPPPKEQTPPREPSPSPPPVVRREPSPSPPPVVQREPSPSPPPVVRREPTPPREPTPQEDEWEEPEQPMYDDVEGAQAQTTGYDDYPPEPEQPLYDDVDPAAEPQEDYYSTADQPPPEEDYYASADQPAADDYPPEPQQELYDDVEAAEPEQDLYDDVQGATGSGMTAKTIYDYQAEDETEISFDVDEIITDIEQIDEGWWRGTRQLDGSFGLFPANYVELV